ncbi:MAG: ABC transporter ATP-binding protein [Armatimonadetes bacterium]|nr:ABC transporter ATP-binding protein [Armatimonadota bacterium]
MSSQLVIEGVNKTFSSRGHVVQALSDVSLEVEPGEIVMLVGPSGCGKSTLLNVIAGLEKVDSGLLTIDGRPIEGPGPDRAVVFQDGALFPWLTVQKNVEFGLRQLGVSDKERAERASEFLANVGLAGFENRNIHELSGGMRQRVAIARALVTNPKVVLMDEPFSALDALTREDLYDQMQELWQASATSVIFVTHNAREAVTLGDRVVLMTPRPGRIQSIFDVRILRPRQVDDADVARLAKRISMEMKYGIGIDDVSEAMYI